MAELWETILENIFLLALIVIIFVKLMMSAKK
jgi:hypothetical protein